MSNHNIDGVPALGNWATGGCGAKVDRTTLLEALSGLRVGDDNAALLAGVREHDDAAILSLQEGRNLVASLDFAPPVCRDPSVAGSVATVNALNDIWACGGTPAIGLSILGMPRESDIESYRTLLGAAESTCANEGALLVGGHSIFSPEPLFGLSVVGFASLDHTWAVAGARPGDIVLLTKPVGVGVIISRARHDAAVEDTLCTLSPEIAKGHGRALNALASYTVHAATDVSGFGLAAHAANIAESSHVTMLLDVDHVPVYDAAYPLFEAGHTTSLTNSNATDNRVRSLNKPHTVTRAVLTDPQTAGPLLLSISRDEAADALESLRSSGYEKASVVGEVVEREDVPVIVR
ncbi:selenide, water dikinase SelD [Nocardia arizonensis]|uniref:selenide, water dikinase SelD n=1 Tax=Nocardia arizonensis TaxID=1141647 RepID=UPI0009E94AB4|nr:selenide, water dikinase SelD [Nocardia arizonensis]